MSIRKTILLGSTLLVAFCSSFGCGFSKYKCKSMQTEAQAQLKALRATMEMLKSETGQYTNDTALLTESGLELNGTYYDIAVQKVTATGFVAQATGKDKMTGDVWKVDQTGTVVAVKDKCQ